MTDPNLDALNRKNGHKVPKESIRYAVVGFGHASHDAILPSFRHAKVNSELRAIVAEDSAKARKLSKKYDVPLCYSYEQFDECLKSGEIDAVYIALPESMHHAYAVAAANAGVHVICEKPMAMSESECQSIITAAEESGVKLMVAYRQHFERANLSAIEAIRSGRIGKPRIFSSVFTRQVPRGNDRLSRDLGSGPLGEIGIYCINAARYLFQCEPEEVVAFEATSEDDRFRYVQESITATIRFPDACLATFTCSFGASDVSEFLVVGTKGNLRADPAYECSEGLNLRVSVDGNIRDSIFPKSDQLVTELVHFSDCILSDGEPQPSGRDGLADVRIIQAIHESIEICRPVRIKRTEIEKQPQVQQIHRLSIAKPQMVHV